MPNHVSNRKKHSKVKAHRNPGYRAPGAKASRRRWEQSVKGRLAKQRKDSKRRAILRGLGAHFTIPEWLALMASVDYKCLWCGKETALTVDHVVPLARGGSNTIDNIQPLCRLCNSTKTYRTMDFRREAAGVINAGG